MKVSWLLLVLLVVLSAAWPARSQGPAPPPFWDVEMQIVDLTNAARTQAGVRPLMVDLRLCTAARSHCQEMLALHYFDHESPTPGYTRPSDRVTREGAHEYDVVGENIARLDGYATSNDEPRSRAALARRMVVGWLNSPDHRDNMLRPQFSTLGVGVAMDGNRVMAGQVFGQLAARRSGW
jgi:uncharacterized protein YkwD